MTIPRLAALALSYLATLAAGPVAAGEPVVGKLADKFVAAFNAGDAKAAAALWTPDANYVDQSGREYKGRKALETLYAKTFAEQRGAKLAITVAAQKEVTPDVVLEDGLSEVTPADGGAGTVARFAAVLVKKDGQWYLDTVRDSVARPPSNVEHLEDLEWLVGDWAGDATKGESATASYSWAENQNFLVSSFATTLNGEPVVGGTQWIGWDPVAKQIRSWSFYSGGGFGEAAWTKDGEKWSLKTTATTADGKKIAVTNVLTKVDADTVAWQPTGLTVDGKAIPDAAPVKMKRVKGN